MDLENLIDEGEGVIDSISANSLVHEIPIAGKAIRMIKAVNDLRNKMFAAKLAKFLQHPELIGAGAREKMRQKSEKSPEGAKRVGETLFLILDRVTDMQKPLWLAATFAAFLADEITSDDWRRVANAIDTAFADDILGLLQIPDSDRNGDRQPLKAALLPSGLSYILPTTFDGGPTFAVSLLGQMLRSAVTKHSAT